MLDWFGLEVFVNVLKPVCFSKSHTYFPCASLESGISDFSYYLILQRVFPDSSVGKESTCNAGDRGSIPRSGRSPGGGHGNPIQYYCPENLMDRGAWQATVLWLSQNRTQLKQLITHARIGTGKKICPGRIILHVFDR